MKREESRLQIDCVRWFRMQHPEPKYLIFAIPNGEARSAITGKILKAQGVRAGAPDLCVMTEGNIFFIEMKSSTGKLSESQKEIKKMVESYGFKHYVCNSIDDFIEIIHAEIKSFLPK